ncbi:hypothetical protein Gotur_021206 [Gossypium turneri]
MFGDYWNLRIGSKASLKQKSAAKDYSFCWKVCYIGR